MPLSVDNIIQQNTGSTETAGAVTVSLLSGVTAGSFVMICAVIDGDGSGVWTLDNPAGGAGTFEKIGGANTSSATMCKPYIWGAPNVGAGETSWTVEVTDIVAQQVVWAVFEVTGVGQNPYGPSWGFAYATLWSDRPDNVLGSDTAVATRSTDTTLGTPAYDWLSFAVHGTGRNDTTVPTISGHTNGYTEIASVNRTNASSSVKMSVSYLPGLVAGTTECTASISPSSATYATVVTLFADGARFAPNVAVMTGYEFGTATGLTNKSALQPTTANFDSSAGTPEISTSHPRSGSYCLKLSSSAAAEYVTWEQGAGTGVLQNQIEGLVVRRRNIYFETSLPAADVPLFSFESESSSNSVVFWFRNATSKIGCKVGTGTEVASDATVSTGNWIGVDYRYDARTTTHTCDWQVDYNADTTDTTGPVAQTQASNTGMAAFSGSGTTVDRTGWSDSRTATVYYDDDIMATHWGSYPIGDHRIVAVGPDQAGTPTISGTSTNFKTFTSNGTLATWTAATTRAVLNDRPPVIGASADGLAQVTAASNDYCEIPMDTFTCAPNYVPRAARWYTAGWAVSTTACTNAIQILDVADPMTAGGKYLAVQGDHGLDNTLLVWMCCMHKTQGFYLLTQAKVDAMRLRWGFSSDATPDVGLHSVFYELAYAPADVVGQSSAEDGAFTIYVRQDPLSGAHASYLGTTPAGTRGMTMYGTIDGVDWSQYVGPNTTGEKVVAADDISHVTGGPGMTPDPSV